MQYHAMYTGTAQIRTPAAIVLTDCVVPNVFRSDAQLGRRFVLVDLGAGANECGEDWFTTCGSGSIQKWRNDPYSLGANADAADCLVSEIIDEFFRSDAGPLTFAEIASRLGFGLLKDENGGDADCELREFFDAVQALPEETAGYFASHGLNWRKFHKTNRMKETEEVQTLWNELTDNGTDLQRLAGANWSKISGVPGMRIGFRSHRCWQGVRFAADRRGGARV